jgi:diaminopimelate decarboxylase
MLLEQPFLYRGGELHCEETSLVEIATQYGTPAYVYSATAIRSRYQAYDHALQGLPHQICFAVKANSNLGVLSLLAQEGAGFDIVSGGELYRALAAGADPKKIVFSGVGKTEVEIRYALLQQIHSFNCESETEVHLISRVATELNVEASIALRVNPDVDASTHPYISTGLREHKFGVDIKLAPDLYRRISKLPGISLDGVSCHIGSQLLNIQPILEAADKVLALVATLRASGINVKFVDLGGGLGVPYRQSEQSTPMESLLGAFCKKLEGSGLLLFLEPGRSIVAEAGVLLSRVSLTKRNGEKTFVVLDAGMNDLIRPALYQAYHEVLPVREVQEATRNVVDVVGPVCESGDFFALNRELSPLRDGDLVVLKTAGAYGFVLSSNYNSRPRACELLVEGTRPQLVRSRETWEDLIRGEKRYDHDDRSDLDQFEPDFAGNHRSRPA